ncbi:MAG: hypothetical protein VYB08_05335 [Candidatus Latescibacterota bacterium]|nr:hypothetical protein [Candidatus Latescibacterota bacterium]
MADDLQIRFAQIDDAAQIAGFNRALARETEDRELDLATVTRGVTRFLEGVGVGFHIVAERGDRIIGRLMITHE